MEFPTYKLFCDPYCGCYISMQAATPVYTGGSTKGQKIFGEKVVINNVIENFVVESLNKLKEISSELI